MTTTRYRSEEAQAYRKLYSTKLWRILREQALLRDSYKCQHRLTDGICGVFLTSGTGSLRSAVVHHISPHRGDLELFYDIDNLQSVCWSCHSGPIQSTEKLGYDTTFGDDGWPIDPNHPCYSS